MSETVAGTGEALGQWAAARFVARRLAWGLLVIWLVLSVTWALTLVMPAPVQGFAPPEDTGLGDETLDSAANDYVNMLTGYLTGDFGDTTILFDDVPPGEEMPQTVTAVYLERAPLTLFYLVPALLVATLVGVTLSTYGAMNRGGIVDRLVSFISYVGIGVPAFVLCEVALLLALNNLGWIQVYDSGKGLLAGQNPLRMLIPFAIVALNFLSVQVQYVRGEVLSYADEEFVKTARAKGASSIRLAVHVFRNAWVSILALVTTELVGLIFLTTLVVEQILEIPGISRALYFAFRDKDPALILSAAFVAAVIGVTGTLARDFSRAFLDPRPN